MPSSHQRNPANTGRRTHGTGTRQPEAAQDMEERLRDDLKNANTELNKVNSERDRYLRLYEQATQKLSETQAAKEDLKAHAQALKEDNTVLRNKMQVLERENDELAYENDAWEECWTALEKSYKELSAQYHAAMPARPSPQRVPETLPDRPRSSHRPSVPREHKDDRARRSDQADREHRAERERLSRRFDEKRSVLARSRRHSFMEAWGPGPMHAPVTFSAKPRTTDLPLSAGLYQPSNAALYDEGYEDGNYHAFPVAR